MGAPFLQISCSRRMMYCVCARVLWGGGGGKGPLNFGAHPLILHGTSNSSPPWANSRTPGSCFGGTSSPPTLADVQD